MMWRTHVAAGVNTVWLITLITSAPPTPLPLLIVVAGVAALLPDIEAKNAKAQHISIAGAKPLQLFRGAFAHRGFTHSLLGIAIVAVVSSLALAQFGWDIPLALTLGYASHPLIDALNPYGVRFLYPSRVFYRILPRSWGMPINRGAEQVLFALFLMGATLLLFSLLLTALQTPQNLLI